MSQNSFGTKASRRASLISSFILLFEFSSYCDTAYSQRSIPAWSSRREHRSGETMVRRRFLFRSPAVESGLFCSRGDDSKVFFRELATMSFASPLVRSVSIVRVCCKKNTRFCTPRSWFVLIGRNSRSMNSAEISVVCSEAKLQHHFGRLDHSSEECLSLLRPLLEILFLAREFLRTSHVIRIDETRSIFPSLGCSQQSCLYY